MTLVELGQMLKKDPEVNRRYKGIEALSDELVAKLALDKHPQFWDFLSPAAQQHVSNARKDSAPDTWLDWILPEFMLNGLRRDNLEYLKDDSDARNHIEAVARASQLGLRLPIYEQLLLAAASTSEQQKELDAKVKEWIADAEHTVRLKLMETAVDKVLREYASNESVALPPLKRQRQPEETVADDDETSHGTVSGEYESPEEEAPAARVSGRRKSGSS